MLTEKQSKVIAVQRSKKQIKETRKHSKQNNLRNKRIKNEKQ